MAGALSRKLHGIPGGPRRRQGHWEALLVVPNPMVTTARCEEVSLDGAVKIWRLGLRRGRELMAAGFCCEEKSTQGINGCARSRRIEGAKKGLRGRPDFTGFLPCTVADTVVSGERFLRPGGTIGSGKRGEMMRGPGAI